MRWYHWIFAAHGIKTHWWIRIGGYGVAVQDLRHHPLFFSQREGYWSMIRVGPYLITWLKPWYRGHA